MMSLDVSRCHWISHDFKRFRKTVFQHISFNNNLNIVHIVREHDDQEHPFRKQDSVQKTLDSFQNVSQFQKNEHNIQKRHTISKISNCVFAK